MGPELSAERIAMSVRMYSILLLIVSAAKDGLKSIKAPAEANGPS